MPDVVAVDASRPGADISPAMFGAFFEDINFAADGGLYPDDQEPLVRVRRAAGRMGRRFMSDGELTVRTDRPLNAGNPHYLRVRVHSPGNGFVVSNAGFRGIGVEAGAG